MENRWCEEGTIGSPWVAKSSPQCFFTRCASFSSGVAWLCCLSAEGDGTAAVGTTLFGGRNAHRKLRNANQTPPKSTPAQKTKVAMNEVSVTLAFPAAAAM